MSQSNIQQYNTIELIDQKYPLFNEYASIYLKPDTRKEWVIRSKMPSIMALAIDLRERIASGGGGFRYVKTKEFLSQEISTTKNPNRFVSGAANAAGNVVTVTVSSPYSGSGAWSVPVVNHYAKANIGGSMKTALITDVTPTASAYELELTFINGESVDMTSAVASSYNWQYNPRVSYTESCSSSIQTEAMLFDAPMVIKGNLQKYEAGQHICEDDLDNYAYNFIPDQPMYVDPLTNRTVNTWCMKEAVMEQISSKMIMGDFQDFLFSERDNVSQKGFDGLFPTTLKRGKMNMPINTKSKPSTLSTLKTIAKIYRNDGITDIALWCDLEMYMNLNQIFAEIPGNNNFNLPIWSGSAQGDINWYGFTGVKNIFGTGVNFHLKMLDGWEQMSLTDLYYNFAIIQPVVSYTTTDGQRVPMMEMVKLEKCDGFQMTTQNSANASIWYDDTRLRGQRKVNVYAKSSLGVEFHGAQFMGILNGGSRCF